MILTAQKDHQLDLTLSWLVGDHDRDIQMAINAGVTSTIRILSHHEPGVTATHTLATTAELASLLDRVLPRHIVS